VRGRLYRRQTPLYRDAECSGNDTAEALRTALQAGKMTVIVSKYASGNVKVPVIEMNPVAIRERFMTQEQRDA